VENVQPLWQALRHTSVSVEVCSEVHAEHAHNESGGEDADMVDSWRSTDEPRYAVQQHENENDADSVAGKSSQWLSHHET